MLIAKVLNLGNVTYINNIVNNKVCIFDKLDKLSQCLDINYNKASFNKIVSLKFIIDIAVLIFWLIKTRKKTN